MQTIYKPKSVWPDNLIYFLTDSTFLHFPYFKNDDQKQVVLNQFKKLIKQGISVFDYSIAVNHYHLKFFLKCGKDIIKIKQMMRGGISYEYRRRFETPFREMWQSRKILFVKSETASQNISGYIAGNLLKHREVSTFEKLNQNKFSSYWHLVSRYGDSLSKQMVKSVIDVNEDKWGVVDIEQLKKTLKH